ncbi:hypothetical protein CUZ87_1197 [Enterococcus xinjiangensis]|nr:hypothetical protein [Enterococcus lactis]
MFLTYCFCKIYLPVFWINDSVYYAILVWILGRLKRHFFT